MQGDKKSMVKESHQSLPSGIHLLCKTLRMSANLFEKGFGNGGWISE